MSKIKKITLFVIILFIAGLAWYLFIKEYDYQITFRAKTSSGTVYQGVRDWAGQMGGNEKIGFKELESEPFKRLVQEINANDSTLQFVWHFKAVNDSLTNVKVGITDTENSVLTRLKIPFVKTWLEKFSLAKIIDFKKGLEIHLKNFKVKIEGKSEIPEKFCAYVTITSKQSEKAMNMIAKNAVITNFLSENDLKMIDYPFLELTSWNIPNEKITYNFCFPINETDSLPNNKEVKFKKISARPAIKAVYNGNYKTSDRAWYALLEYAEQNNIKINETPIEFFFNNPMEGGDELTWKADIYLPIE